MFTGIITHIAKIAKIEFNKQKDCLLALELQSEIDRKFEIGCSIACNGVCLTLIKKDQKLLYFQASKESCDVTTIKNWKNSQEINLEFALRLGDEFGGHIVSGHVDGVAKLIDSRQVQDSWRLKFVLENKELMKFIAKKGSICVDGISLTVNEVFDDSFEVNIIEHTKNNTNLRNIKEGDFVNIEVDLIARYVNKNN